jgi:hypothetical protein
MPPPLPKLEKIRGLEIIFAWPESKDRFFFDQALTDLHINVLYTPNGHHVVRVDYKIFFWRKVIW